ALRERLPLRLQPPERAARGAGEGAAVAQEDGGVQGVAGEDRGGDPGLPLVLVDQGDRSGPRAGAAAGEERLGNAGRVGDRVGAADAGGVARGGHRKAELGGGLLAARLDALPDLRPATGLAL